MPIIRDYRLDDTYHVHRIAFLSLDEKYVPEIFVYFQSQWSSGQIVACGYDGVPIGFISALRAEGPSARIMMFAVDPDHRSEGAGTMLLNELRRRAAAERMNGMSLEVRDTNDAAIAFYRKNGFVPADLLEGFYNDGGNAIRMVQLNI